MEWRSNFPVQLPTSDSDGQETSHTVASRPLEDGSNTRAHIGGLFDDVTGFSDQAFEAEDACSPAYNGPKDGDVGGGGLTSDTLPTSIVGHNGFVSQRRERAERTDGQVQFGNRHNHAALQYTPHDHVAAGGDQFASHYTEQTPSPTSYLYPTTLDGISCNRDKRRPNTINGPLSWRSNFQFEQNYQPQSDVPPAGSEVVAAQTTTQHIASGSRSHTSYTDDVGDGESIVFSQEALSIDNPLLALVRDEPYRQSSQSLPMHHGATSSSGSRIGKHKASSPPADDRPRRAAQPYISEPVNNIMDDQIGGTPSANRQPSFDQNRGQEDGYAWACPFAKRSKSYDHICYKHKFEDVSRIKQHLKRVHLIGVETDQTDERSRGKNGKNHERTITEDQRNRIQRKMPAQEVESWNKIFQILFPEAPLPSSPYVDNNMPVLHRGLMECFESKMEARRNELAQIMALHAMARETITQIFQFSSDSLRETLQDFSAESLSDFPSGSSQSAHSSYDQGHPQLQQQHEDTGTTSVSVHRRATVSNPMNRTRDAGVGQRTRNQSHHITTGHMTQFDMYTQQQNSPNAVRDAPMIHVSQYSPVSASPWQSTNPNPSSRNLPNALDGFGSRGRAGQEIFLDPSADWNTGQSSAPYLSEFGTPLVGSYGSRAQYQPSHNWGQHGYQEQEQEQEDEEEDEETQQQQLQVPPDRSEYPGFWISNPETK